MAYLISISVSRNISHGGVRSFLRAPKVSCTVLPGRCYWFTLKFSHSVNEEHVFPVEHGGIGGRVDYYTSFFSPEAMD